MPYLKTEVLRTEECIVNAPLGDMSFLKETVANGQNFGACRVLGKITASGKYVACDPAANDGSQVASRIARRAVDATAGDTPAITLGNWIEVNASELDFGAMTPAQIATAKAQLLVATIFVREAV